MKPNIPLTQAATMELGNARINKLTNPIKKPDKNIKIRYVFFDKESVVLINWSIARYNYSSSL
jgi:hypothetical protein